jgi:phosphoglycolate phosphatase
LISPAILFDLDGTLTDPRLGIVSCIKYALSQLERPYPSDEILASFIGPPLRGTFSTLLGTSNINLIEEAMKLYRHRFTDKGIYENHLYEGIPDMLQSARRAGYFSFVATSKPTVYADRIVKYFGLDQHFIAVYGSELGGQLDDKADLLAFLLKKERIPSERAVMVGDRAADIFAAKRNGVRSVGVLWGYGSGGELSGAGADELCSTPGELVFCLSQLAGSRFHAWE